MIILRIPLLSLENTALMTGGTGAKVRPVVSCKGTTCQYGLIDTFALSRKIHERFYVGYHDVVSRTNSRLQLADVLITV